MRVKSFFLFLMCMSFEKTNAVGSAEWALGKVGQGIDSVVGSEMVQNLPENIYSGVQNMVPYLQNLADSYTGVLVANQLGVQNYIPDTLSEYVPAEMGLGVERDFQDAATQAFALQMVAHPVRTAQLIKKGVEQGVDLSKQAVNRVATVGKNAWEKLPSRADLSAYSIPVEGYINSVVGKAQDFLTPYYNSVKNSISSNQNRDEEVIRSVPHQSRNMSIRIDPSIHANQNRGAPRQAGLSLDELMTKVKDEGTRYTTSFWQALCQKLSQASEGEKRQAIDNLGAKDFVRDNYDDNPSFFIDALTDELENFQLDSRIGQRTKDLGAPLPPAARGQNEHYPSNFPTFYKKIKDYLEFCTAHNIVNRPIIRGFVYGSFGVLAQSLDDLFVTFIALSSASDRLTVESARTLVRSYLRNLPAEKQALFQNKVRSLLTEDGFFTDANQPFMNTFNIRALKYLNEQSNTVNYRQNLQIFI